MIQNKRLIDNLDLRMKVACATNETLASKSGVGLSTIARLRTGTPVKVFIADCIEETLNTQEFQYAKMGRPKTSVKKPKLNISKRLYNE